MQTGGLASGETSTRSNPSSSAEDEGFDLVEVSPEASPPVCKIIDYGKLKYREQKSKKEAKKKQKSIEVKEIKMRPGIDTHDYNVKVKAFTLTL